MIGEAVSMGAVSVVNAMASGRGATVSVDLPTSARVEVNGGRGKWEAFLNGKRTVSPLVSLTVRRAIRMLGKDPGHYSGSVRTVTSAPVGVGLKTSSSSSVAIILALLAAFGKEGSYGAERVLKCSAAASIAAGVSVTGAMDDAASCLLGGVNFADNLAGRLLSSARLGRPKAVVIRIPRGGSRRTSVDLGYVRRFSELADSAFQMARQGRIWKAMTINGVLYSSIYGYPPRDGLEALQAGAVGAGLSGTGPAVAAVFEDWKDSAHLARLWRRGGARVLMTESCDGGASIVR